MCINFRWLMLLKKIVAKASDGQRFSCPAYVGCNWSWGRSRAAAPKELMTYAFTHEEISPSPSSSGWEFGLRDEVWDLELGFGLQGWIFFLRLGFGLWKWDSVWGWDLGLEARIWGSGLEFGRIWLNSANIYQNLPNLAKFCRIW